MSSLFGSKSKSSGQVQNFTPTGISAGGITAGGKGTITATSSPERQGLFQSLSDVFKGQAGELNTQKQLLTPGFGQLTSRGVNAIRDRSRVAIGDLASNLQRRRVLGSSFGQDAVSRAKAEFAKQEADFKAESFLQELDATVNLINQETTAAANSYQTLISNMDFEADIATQLASQATSALSNIATYNAQAAAQASQGKGSLFGTILGTGLKAAALFGSGGTAAPAVTAPAVTGFNASASMLGVSDERLKENVTPLEEMNGYQWYEFNYLWDKVKRIGVMAQDIMKINPDAVIDKGYLMVDYGRLTCR